MRVDRWIALERLLARQHGVVAAWQATALGVPNATLRGHARAHGWEPLGRGIWGTPWSAEDFRRRCVVERVRGPRARLVTGGALLTLLGVRQGTCGTVDLWVRPGLSIAKRPDVRIIRTPWVPGDRAHRVDHLPCTPPLRALRDAASASSPQRLERDLRSFDRLRIATPAEVRADLARRGRFRGKPKLVLALDRVDEELVHSEPEAEARVLVRRAGYVAHPRPLLIVQHGRRLGEIDIPLCRWRYGIEVDGPSHREDGQEDRDRMRDHLLLHKAGWRIDRFTDSAVRTDPHGVVEAVRRGAAEAAARGLDPWRCGVCA